MQLAWPPAHSESSTPRPPYMAVDDTRVYMANVSRSKFYELVREGRITLLKMGRKTVADMATVDAYMASLPRVAPRAVKAEAA